MSRPRRAAGVPSSGASSEGSVRAVARACAEANTAARRRTGRRGLPVREYLCRGGSAVGGPVGHHPQQRAQLLQALARLLRAPEEQLLQHEAVERGEDQPRERPLLVAPDRAQLALDERDVLVVDGSQLGEHLRTAARLEAELVLEQLVVRQRPDRLGQSAAELLTPLDRVVEERHGERLGKAVLEGLVDQRVARAEVV